LRRFVLEVVSLSYGCDLLEMVPAVNKLEHAPLVDAEWTKDDVAGTSIGSEESFGLNTEGAETREVLARGLGEFAA
jgi:hypothetical protein